MQGAAIKRPVLITIVCILGFVWIVFSFPGVFSPSLKKLGDWYPALFGILVATSFISYIGLWHMKRWGVRLFIVSFFIKEILLVMINDVSFAGVVFSVFFICSILPFYKRMDINL
jgi:membrane protease YdiL (CAAX protease family)